MRARVAGLALVLLAACVGTEGASPPAPAARAAAVPPPAPADTPGPDGAYAFDDEPVHRLFGCLSGDSAVYADVREDPNTGDTVGVWITFWQAGDGIDGASVSSAGNGLRTAPEPFSRVQLAGADSLALDLPHGGGEADTTRLVGRVSCERLWGRQRTHRDMPTRPALYRRQY